MIQKNLFKDCLFELCNDTGFYFKESFSTKDGIFDEYDIFVRSLSDFCRFYKQRFLYSYPFFKGFQEKSDDDDVNNLFPYIFEFVTKVVDAENKEKSELLEISEKILYEMYELAKKDNIHEYIFHLFKDYCVTQI